MAVELSLRGDSTPKHGLGSECNFSAATGYGISIRKIRPGGSLHRNSGCDKKKRGIPLFGQLNTRAPGPNSDEIQAGTGNGAELNSLESLKLVGSYRNLRENSSADCKPLFATKSSNNSRFAKNSLETGFAEALVVRENLRNVVVKKTHTPAQRTHRFHSWLSSPISGNLPYFALHSFSSQA